MLERLKEWWIALKYDYSFEMGLGSILAAIFVLWLYSLVAMAAPYDSQYKQMLEDQKNGFVNDQHCVEHYKDDGSVVKECQNLVDVPTITPGAVFACKPVAGARLICKFKSVDPDNIKDYAPVHPNNSSLCVDDLKGHEAPKGTDPCNGFPEMLERQENADDEELNKNEIRF